MFVCFRVNLKFPCDAPKKKYVLQAYYMKIFRQLQLPCCPVPHAPLGQLPPDPELPALHPDRGRILGLLLDGHRVRPGQDQPGRHHTPRRFLAGRIR